MTITELLVPTYRQQLQMLLGLLDKAQLQVGPDKAQILLSARLAPDMFRLTTQLRFCAVQAQEAPLRLMGLPLDCLDPLLDEGRNGATAPGTWNDARARLEEALEFLDGLAPNALDQQPPDAPLALTLPMGLTFDLTREQFARDWAIGQFYFHLMAAYAILRSQGIELGKADYLPHLLPFVRQQGETRGVTPAGRSAS